MQKHSSVDVFLVAPELQGYTGHNLLINNFNFRTIVSIRNMEGTSSNLLGILASSPLIYEKVH